MDHEICICSAVITECGKIIRGHRHSDCIKAVVERGLRLHRSPVSQGFMTSENRYVTRVEGLDLQKKAGIESRQPTGYGFKLTSEDLY